MNIEELDYLIKLLTEKHLEIKSKKQMEFIMEIKSKLRQQKNKILDNQ